MRRNDFRLPRALPRALPPRLLPLLLLLCVALFVAAACRGREDGAAPASTAAAAGSPAAARPLVVATRSDFLGPNELLGTSRFSHEVRSNLFLHLMREQPDFQQHPPTFGPELAKSWQFSPDRLTLSFELRDDVRWSDGQPVTAEDVRFTWQAQTSPDVGWASAYQKEAIRDVEVTGPHSVRFHFTRAYPTQLLDANEGFVLPSHAWKELPFAEWAESADWFAEHLVVDGPFTVERHTRKQELVLARNPRYHQAGKPKLDRVVFRIVPDEAAQLQELLGGKVDVMEGIPADRFDEVEKSPHLHTVALWARQYTFLVWNLRRPPFDLGKVRTALTLAIDRPALVDALWHGHARVASSPIPTTVWAHDATLQPLPYDPAQARKLLAEAGFVDGDGDGIVERAGKPFRFALTTTTGNQARRDALVLIQEQLRRVGIDAQPTFIESAALAATAEKHDFDALLSAWGIDTGLSLRTFDSQDSEGLNWGGYKDAEVDRLLDQLDAENDPARRKPLYDQVQQRLARDQPYTFLWEPQWLVGIADRVDGAAPNPLLTFGNLEDWSLR